MAKSPPPKRPKHQPLRTCSGCGGKRPKKELIRVVRTPSGGVEVDLTGRRPGRGAYVCPGGDCLKLAVKGKRLERSLEAPVPDEVVDALARAVASAASGEPPAPARTAEPAAVARRPSGGRSGRDPMKG